jgi:hypothetical protein
VGGWVINLYRYRIRGFVLISDKKIDSLLFLYLQIENDLWHSLFNWLKTKMIFDCGSVWVFVCLNSPHLVMVEINNVKSLQFGELQAAIRLLIS